jgi:uncharacterized protein
MTGTDLLLFAAGILGGAINSVAGGATLFTFPALTFAGLPPIIANASSSFALTPGHLFAAIADRKLLPLQQFSFWLTLAISAIGGAVGAVLLFSTSERVFAALIPVLIGIATLIFAFGKRLQTWLRAVHGAELDSPLARNFVMIPVGIYGGYFGAGMGVILMAAFAITSRWDLRTANAAKNLLGAFANWTAIAIFIFNGLIAWRPALIMLAGCMIGGFLGARSLAVIPAHVMRLIVVAAGTVMTVIYIWRYWISV